jgi:hypothetical protein
MEGADVYIDGVGALFFNGQVVKIDLITLYPDPKDNAKVNPRLAGRLAMPINAAVQLRDNLNRLMADIQKAQESQKTNATASKPPITSENPKK